MKNYKKIVDLLLAATTAFTLCACGGAPAEQTGSLEETTAAAEEAATTETAAETAAAGSFSLFHFHEEDGAGDIKGILVCRKCL